MEMSLTDYYQERYTLFIDILGFKRKIEQIGNNSPLSNGVFENIIKIQNVILPSSEKFFTNISKFDRNIDDLQITVFSDSIVISCHSPKNPFSGAFFAIMAAFNLSKKLLAEGALTRGGIAKNLLYHKNGVVFGKALIEAYKLENEVACYPRIVVDNDVVNIWKTSIKNITPWIDVLVEDPDGFYRVDFFNKEAFLVDSENLIARIASHLESILGNPDEIKTKKEWSKIVWITKKYNEAVMDTENKIVEIPQRPFT